MDGQGRDCDSGIQSEEEMVMRRGPWSIEEDLVLVNYIAKHGEGRWNSLARCSGTIQFQNFKICTRAGVPSLGGMEPRAGLEPVNSVLPPKEGPGAILLEDILNFLSPYL